MERVTERKGQASAAASAKDCHAQTAPPKAKGSCAASGKAKARPPKAKCSSAAVGKAKAPRSEAVAELVRVTPPRVDVERSRSQVLCRTGFRGAGQSCGIRYGPGEAHRTEAAAAKAFALCCASPTATPR